MSLVYIQIPALFLLSALISLYLIPHAISIAVKYNIVDFPDNRLKTHGSPTPYLGGSCVLGGFLFALALTTDFTLEMLGLIVGGILVAMMGLIDDLAKASPLVKTIGILAAIGVMIRAGVMIQVASWPPYLQIPLTVLWLFLIANAFNLIDVSDGLCALTACAALFFFGILSVLNGNLIQASLCAALGGAVAGFLKYNWPKARIYLGDSGSLFLGVMVGGIALSGQYTASNEWGFIAPLVILAVPLFEFTWLILIRTFKGIPFWKGSPHHFSHYLRRLGLGASGILFLTLACAILLGALGILITRMDTLGR